jgi:hypothetical protein
METQNSPVPPPPPDYFVLKGGHILGPFDIDELRAAISENRIDLSDFVQTGGLPIWRPLARVLGMDGSTSYGAVAPDWRSILTWAWLRLRYNLDEQSLAAGLIFFGIALVALPLARFSFLIWLPWLIPAAVAAVALIRRRQVLPGVALLLAVCAVPILEARYHFGSRSATRGTSSKSLVNGAVQSNSRTEPGTEPSAWPAPSDARLAVETLPLLAGSTPSAPLPGLTEPAPEAPPPSPAEPRPSPSAPPALVAAANPSAAAVQPTATIPPLTKPVPPATTSIATALPPAPPPPLIPTSLPKPAPGTTDIPGAGNADLVQGHRDSLIVIRDREGAGSGFLCKKGERVWLFTNNHVAAGMRQPIFSRLDGTRINVSAAESAAGYDAMRFALTESPALPLESVTDLEGVARIGDDVVVLGNSGGGGVVTSIKGELVGIGPDRIEVSAAFIPGNSGSPIIHVPTGKVIGIATYISRRYEEFSAGGQPQGRGAGKPAGLRGQGTVVTRRFGYRLDNVPRWEPVNWQAFQNEAEQLRQISSLTEDIFNFLGTLRAGDAPQFASDTLRRPAQLWFDTVRKPRLSEVDKTNATHSFLNSLRYMVRADVTAAESRLRYNYFRERLSEERTVRDKLYQAFDSEARRLASPSSR